jgi:hypothetical protein
LPVTATLLGGLVGLSLVVTCWAVIGRALNALPDRIGGRHSRPR